MEEIFPNDENGAALRRMEEQGDNLSLPRDVDFSIVFPNEGSAQIFSRRIQQHFNKISQSKLETSNPLRWDVTATRFMVPTHNEITAIEKMLEHAASPLGGQNDGWGCFHISR